jgi:choline kinase
MKALLLAAGDGDRMHAVTGGGPKLLLPLAGRPIIHHSLESLSAAGVTDVTIVLGYRGESVRRAVEALRLPNMTVRFAENDAYMLGNAYSIWSARDEMADAPFVLAMADHLVEPAITRALLQGGGDRCRLAVERAGLEDPRADEATRARVRRGKVIDLGKSIEQWNALDTGVFWCSPRIFEVLTEQMRDGEAGAVFATLARAGELDAVDVTGRRWIDIDTPLDLREAEALLPEIMTWRDGRVA